MPDVAVDLRELLDAVKARGERLDPRAVTQLARELGRAVAAMHARGDAHGAIATSAIVVTPAGDVRLLAPGSASDPAAGRDRAALAAVLHEALACAEDVPEDVMRCLRLAADGAAASVDVDSLAAVCTPAGARAALGDVARSAIDRMTNALDATLADGRADTLALPVEQASGEQPDELVGRVLAHRFEVLSAIGAGGMGAVYRARDRELDELVALKVLRPEIAASDGFVARFRREVKLARRVTHPNVARTFELGEHDGVRFLTMELVDGESLASVLRRVGTLTLRRAVEILACACDALSAAHSASVVHRDIKPDNILIASDGRAVVTDFGIAASLDDPRGDPRGATSSGAVIGTPAYMAPEQVEGGELGPATDVYALGIVAFEMLTGALPFDGSTVVTMMTARIMKPPRDPRAVVASIPDGIAYAILRALAKRPEARFATAAEMKEAFVEAARGIAASSTAPRVRAHAARVVARVHTLAVLPFAAHAVEPWLAEGLAEELNDALATARGIRVLSRAAVVRSPDPRALGANVAVEGTLRGGGGEIRASLRLVDLEEGIQIWTARHALRTDAVLAIADDAARAITSALGAECTGGRDEPIPQEALELYVRARQLYARFSFADLGRAVAMLRDARARAPGHPVIESGLALALTRASFFDPRGAGSLLAEAHAVATHALTIAPQLGEPNLALGQLALHGGDPVAAARAFRAAITRAPSLAEAHVRLGQLLLEAGETSAGARRVESGLSLDSTLADARWELARTRALDGDWPAYHEIVARILRDGPRARWLAHARYAAWEGRFDDIASLERDAAAVRADELFDAGMLGALFDVFLRRDPRKLWEVAATVCTDEEQRNRRRTTFFLQLVAECEAFLGEHDRALAALARADEGGLADVAWLRRCPMIAAIRKDARFEAAAERIGARAEGVVEAMWS